jgi:hypothetical protein
MGVDDDGAAVGTAPGSTESAASHQPLADDLVADLRSAVRGTVLVPGDVGYDDARTVWNAMIDRRPVVVVRAAVVDDVIVAVDFARENGLLFSVRGGGHNVTGSAVADGGLMLDLSAMKEIVVDANMRTARAQAGCLWSDLDAATQEFGLAVTGGQASDTGIAGLTLGGGVGQLMRFCGATVDNLLSVDLVTADGELLTVSADEHPDLFWAVRGGAATSASSHGSSTASIPSDRSSSAASCCIRRVWRPTSSRSTATGWRTLPTS